MAKTKVLMIGGTGIISTDCSLLALQQPDIDLYLLNRGKTPNFLPPDTKAIHADVNREDDLRQALAGHDFDVCCDFFSYDQAALESKLRALRGHCRHYIFISSIMAYRASEHLLKTEANTPIGNARWTYGWEKSCCEMRLRQECADTGMAFTIVRPGYTYNRVRFFNPWSISHWRSWTLAERLLSGKPYILHDDGMQLCTITHTRDFAKAFVGLFNNPAAVNEDFHITSTTYLTWKRVAEIQAELLGVKPVFHCLPAEKICAVVGYGPAQKVVHCCSHDIYDNSKIRAAVPAFSCTTSFEDGMAESIRFYRDNPAFQQIDPAWAAWFDTLAKIIG
ncbi:MAG: NAD-dependent epimerase/dehydratase family protein [Lentisphaerae bacterium]|nr:NAD-dependent epimerase/dehydratase family protein [Lentisphaerota bacterium]